MPDHPHDSKTSLPDLVAYIVNQPICKTPTNSLVPAKNNAKQHTKKQIQLLANSILTFGFITPILIDGNNTVLAGHGRLEAAKQLGLKHVPTLCIDHLSPEALRAYRIADNRLAELANWDNKTLAIELQDLQARDLDFGLSVTGFETPEIDLKIQSLAADPDPDDDIQDVNASKPVISRDGDIWDLGDHKLACLDARLHEGYENLMKGQQASMIITDPPYNVRIHGHVGGLGTIRHAEFAMASGEMSPDEFIKFLVTIFTLMSQYSLPGSLHYIFMDWRHMDEILSAGNSVFDSLKNVCVWNKDNGGMGSMYRSKHELIFVFKKGKVPHINNVQLGRYGRYRTNVWDYPGVNSFGSGRIDDLKMHPTVKPVALVADAILDASNRGDLVLDPFGGSGTTIIAAEKVGRKARIIEIDPRYVDISIRRWEQATGSVAIHANTGLSYNETANRRLSVHCSTVSSTTRQEGTRHV